MATTTSKLGLTKPSTADAVDIAVFNTNADKIDAATGAYVCTSTSRPSTPYGGQMIFETDTQMAQVYVPAVTNWVPVANYRVQATAPTSPVLNMLHFW